MNPLKGHVLVPGCGRGHDVRAIAAAGADEVIGLDLAPSAFAGAETLPNTRFVLGDLFALPADFTATFDAVFEHTCFCAIPRERRDDYVQAVAKALKPGGLLLALFYLTPRDNPDPTLGPPFNASLEELDARFAEHFTLLRSETPVPTVNRITMVDAEHAGCPISKGDRVTVLLAAFNHDPETFSDPESVDFTRDSNKHFGFGAGVHRCLGSHLARLELRVAMTEWHRRIPEYRIADGHEIKFAPSLREIPHLPLVFAPGAREG